MFTWIHALVGGVSFASGIATTVVYTRKIAPKVAAALARIRKAL